MPSGHPEGFIEAFANVYMSVAAAIRAKKEGVKPDGLSWDFPTVYEGARGVHFIEKTVESSQSDKKWLDARLLPEEGNARLCKHPRRAHIAA